MEEDILKIETEWSDFEPYRGQEEILKILIRQKGQIWIFHKNDSDPFPSVPHGHNKETGNKLNPYDGRIYDKYGNSVSRLNHKKLEDIQNRLKSKGFLQ